MSDDLVKGTINYDGLTAKYVKEHNEALQQLTEEIVNLIHKQVEKDETVDVFRDNWEAKYRKLKEENIG